MENTPNGQRPQLKKIRRPINRTISQAAEERNVPVVEKTVVPSVDDADLDLDAYLDEPSLPVKGSRENDIEHEIRQESPQYLSEEEYKEELYGPQPEGHAWLSLKMLIFIGCMSLFVGVVLGKLLFGTSKIVHNGLQGVVINSEVPRGRARCGVAERNQGCVLYLMNPQRQDMRARDFYDLAAQMTGRQRFMIETGNMRYANSKIKPGDIAQLNIPPL